MIIYQHHAAAVLLKEWRWPNPTKTLEMDKHKRHSIEEDFFEALFKLREVTSYRPSNKTLPLPLILLGRGTF